MIQILLAGFALGWIGSMPLAGAVSIFVFQRGLAGRFQRGLALAAGASLAESVWCVVALYGADKLLKKFPGVGSIAESIGGLILIGLGIYFATRKNSIPTDSELTDEHQSQNQSLLRREFWLGFTLVAGNPSVPLNWLALIAVVVSLGLDPMAKNPGLFVAGVGLGIVGWFGLLLRLLMKFRTRFSMRALDLIMRVMGAGLMIVGLITLIRAWV